MMPTRAPSVASPIAVALPMPPVPPVIRTTLPAMGSVPSSARYSSRLSPLVHVQAGARRTIDAGSCMWPVEGSDGDDDRSARMSFSDMTDRLGGPTQWVRPVDDRCDLPGFDESLQDDQVRSVRKLDGRA